MGHVVRVVKCTRTGASSSSGVVVVASPALLQIYVLPVPLVMIHSKVLVLFLILSLCIHRKVQGLAIIGQYSIIWCNVNVKGTGPVSYRTADCCGSAEVVKLSTVYR
jgi:hypothetical protein